MSPLPPESPAVEGATYPKLLRKLARSALVPAVIGGLHLPALPSSAGIRFRDVAKQAGITVVTRNDAQGRKYQAETMLGGIAVLDFDSDGWMDIYVANGASLPSLAKNDAAYWNALYRNNGNGTFRDVTRSAGVQGEGFSIGVAVGDFDNDGWEDLYVCVSTRTLCTTTMAMARLRMSQSTPELRVTTRMERSSGRSPLLGSTTTTTVSWTSSFQTIATGRREPSWSAAALTARPGPIAIQTRIADSLRSCIAIKAAAHSGMCPRRQESAKSSGKGMGLAVADFDVDGYQDVFIANSPQLPLPQPGNGKFREAGIPLGVAFNGDGRYISGWR